MSVKKYSKSNAPRKNYNYGTEGDTVLITATGGNTITTVGAYKIHTFTSSGTFAITAGTNQKLEYLFSAGGGPAGRGNGSGACSGAGGGVLMNWIGLANTVGGQCIGPDIYAKLGDSFAVTPGAGGVYTDNNSLQNCGGDTIVTKNSKETYTIFGGGGGGGGTSAHVGYNGGCGSGSAGTGQNGTNMWPAGSILTGEYQYQFNFGRTNGPFKQGNGNSDPTKSATVANQRQFSSGGALTLAPYYLTATTDTTRGPTAAPWPGFGVRTSFNGSAVQSYGDAGLPGTTYTNYGGATGKPPTPSTVGAGGWSCTTTGISGDGSAGQVIFRYLNSNTIAAANVELLLVGGGGGQYLGGGGGGGSVIYYGNESSNTGGPLTLYTGTYPITVGAGGVRSTAIATSPAGTHTSMLGVPTVDLRQSYGSFDAFGGSSYPRPLSEYFGSGVGAAAGTAAPNFTYGLPNPLHGTIGGQGAAAVGGGGGGAGTAGGNGTATNGPGGAGGNGKLYTTLGAWGTDASNSTVPTSGKGYFGGGGGGAKTTAGGSGGTAGIGGGGAGLAGTTGVSGSGIANTGGGGGGGISAATGGAGGSGIVILRYPDTYPAATSTTGTPTVTASGGWRTYVWLTSGSITFG